MIDIAAGLLAAAEKAIRTEGAPDEVAVRRAVSSCYYAVYHALAKAFADALLGGEPDTRPNSAWIEVYRGLDHQTCLEACNIGLPPEKWSSLK